LSSEGNDAECPITREDAVGYTAEIAISSKVTLGDKCAVTVVNDDDIRQGMEATETALLVDGDHTRQQVIDAAEDLLVANGWKVTGDWEDGDNSYYAPVEPA
jgi:hypothetical protein